MYKQSSSSIKKQVQRAIDLIDQAGGPVALFLINGQLRCARKYCDGFDERFEKWKKYLIGVYDQAVDFRDVYIDIADVMKSGDFSGVDIDAIHDQDADLMIVTLD